MKRLIWGSTRDLGTYPELPSTQRAINACTVIRRVARQRPGSLFFNIIWASTWETWLSLVVDLLFIGHSLNSFIEALVGAKKRGALWALYMPEAGVALRRHYNWNSSTCLADEIAEPRPGMNTKVTAFTVSEMSINTLLLPAYIQTLFSFFLVTWHTMVKTDIVS